jgi:hypothetical protein
MTPSEYASIVVVPTVREYLSAMGDQRRAYLACIATYHLTDYLAKAINTNPNVVIENMRGVCANSFNVVQGICHGSKHCGRTGGIYKFQPGAEEVIAPAGYGSGGYGHFRYGGAPGLVVEHNNQRMLVDFCLRAVLDSFGRLYPGHLAAEDLTSFAIR